LRYARAAIFVFPATEEYLVAFLGAVLTGTTDPAVQSNPSARRNLAESDKLRTRIERSKTTNTTIGDERCVVWKPEIERIIKIVVKNARGHALFEYGEPMLNEPTHVWSMPLVSLTATERVEFENNTAKGLAPWPEVGTRMMTRVMTGQDLSAGWVVVQDGVYRYALMRDGRMRVKTVIREYLASEVHWED
jgi:hypothetical protein